LSKLVIVLGEQPGVDGTFPVELQNRVELANRQVSPGDTIIFTGGETTKGVPAEAELAFRYFECICRYRVNVRLESSSKTTGDNIRLSRGIAEKMEEKADSIVVIGRASQIPKTKVFMMKLWPEADATYISGIDTKPLWWRLVDQSVFLLLAHLDPHDTVVRWLTKKARNG